MRGLKALVIFLGIVIAVMFAIVVGEIGRRIFTAKPGEPDKQVATMPMPAPQPIAIPPIAPPPIAPPANPGLGVQMPPAPLPGFGERQLELPAGARVADFSASGDRLVLRLVMPDQEQRLMIVDLATGNVIGTLTLGGSAKARPPEITVPPRNIPAPIK